jgi:hypothetical protein
MLLRIVAPFPVAALALSAVLSACGGASPTVPVGSGSLARAQLASAPPLSKSDGGLVYTAQLYGQDAEVYRRKGLHLKPIKTLMKGLNEPQGTVTTVNGWWYIANEGDSNVLIYRTLNGRPRGPQSSLSDYDELPVNVDVTPSRKLAAVSNYLTTDGAAGSVSIYLDRESVPSRMLTYGSDQIEGEGIAISHRGDCYWSFQDATTGSGSIVEFGGCQGTGTPIVSGIGQAGGIALDQADDLYYVDTRAARIYQCEHTSSCQPLLTGPYVLVAPVNINFDLHEKDLWVADAGGYIDAINAKTGVIEYQYPTGSSNPPFGVAPEPGD